MQPKLLLGHPYRLVEDRPALSFGKPQEGFVRPESDTNGLADRGPADLVHISPHVGDDDGQVDADHHRDHQREQPN